MRKGKLFAITLALACITVFGGCRGGENKAKGQDDETWYTVTFDVDGGSEVKSQKVIDGGKAEKPDDPFKASSETVDYEFGGWFNGDVEWDFENGVVNADLTLTAKWLETGYAVFPLD